MNDINDDILKVNCGNGDGGSRRCWLSRDRSHWLDTLNVSNSSSRNWNSWFVAIIASLNIVAKTFAKIAKMFTCPYSLFRRKICKNGLQKWNLHESQLLQKVSDQLHRKVNGQRSKKSKVNHGPSQLKMTSAIDGDVSKWCGWWRQQVS